MAIALHLLNGESSVLKKSFRVLALGLAHMYVGRIERANAFEVTFPMRQNERTHFFE